MISYFHDYLFIVANIQEEKGFRFTVLFILSKFNKMRPKTKRGQQKLWNFQVFWLKIIRIWQLVYQESYSYKT